MGKPNKEPLEDTQQPEEVQAPQLPGGFSLGVWAGHTNYACAECGAATLSLAHAEQIAEACGCKGA